MFVALMCFELCLNLTRVNVGPNGNGPDTGVALVDMFALRGQYVEFSQLSTRHRRIISQHTGTSAWLACCGQRYDFGQGSQ